MGNITLKQFLSVLNMKVNYKVVEKFTRKEIPLSEIKDKHCDRVVYMVFPLDNGIKIVIC